MIRKLTICLPSVYLIIAELYLRKKSATLISIPTTSHGPHKGPKISFTELIFKVKQDTCELKHSTIKEKEQK